MKFFIQPEWMLQHENGITISLPVLLRLLAAVRAHGSISGAAAASNLSYRHAWGLLREFETLFGTPLVLKARGQGTVLSPLAEKLIWADKRIAARLSPMLDSLASELERELEALLPTKRQALRLIASHGFAVDELVKQLSVRDIAVDLRYRGSKEAVAALARGECELAGFHLPVGEFEQAAFAEYAPWLNPAEHQLVHLAYRRLGLFVGRGNPKGITRLADLTRNDVRFVNRQNGSGTRVLLELLLQKQGIDIALINGFETAEFTHAAVAAFVASGMADVSFGVETAAKRFDLEFIPVIRERYFFACHIRDSGLPVIEAALDVMRSEVFQAVVNQLPGYDGTQSGNITSISDVTSLS